MKEVKKQQFKELKETIEVPIYFNQEDNGKINIDTDSIKKEFYDKLNKVIKNPNRFLEARNEY